MSFSRVFTCIAVLGVLVCSSAHGAVLTVAPNAVAIEQGGQVAVDVVISDLGDGDVPSLGVFDIDLFFDSAILSLDGVTFGNQLDLFGFGSLQFSDDSVSGLVNLFELSFDLPDDLDVLQAPSFILATLVFDALAMGSSGLTLSIKSLGDSLGDELQASIVNSSVTVTASPVSEVPLPASFLLFLSGLAAIRWKRMCS